TSAPSLSVQGIWIFRQTGGGGLAKIYHNNIYLTSNEAVSYNTGGIHLRGGSTGLFEAEIYNNIVVNNISTTSGAYRAYALVDGNSDRGYFLSDYNVL